MCSQRDSQSPRGRDAENGVIFMSIVSYVVHVCYLPFNRNTHSRLLSESPSTAQEATILIINRPKGGFPISQLQGNASARRGRVSSRRMCHSARPSIVIDRLKKRSSPWHLLYDRPDDKPFHAEDDRKEGRIPKNPSGLV